MLIYLIRHGLAYDPEGADYEDDVQRPLTNKGEEKIKTVAGVLRNMKIKPDVVLSSPYVRAIQSAQILAKRLGYKAKKIELSDALVPMAQAEAMIDEILDKYLVEELMLVGHEPSLGLLISALTVTGQVMPVNVRYGSVCCLHADDFHGERKATLEWFLTPKLAARI